jgi:hypothetical protein
VLIDSGRRSKQRHKHALATTPGYFEIVSRPLPGQSADCSLCKRLPSDPASGPKTVRTVVWQRVK